MRESSVHRSRDHKSPVGRSSVLVFCWRDHDTTLVVGYWIHVWWLHCSRDHEPTSCGLASGVPVTRGSSSDTMLLLLPLPLSQGSGERGWESWSGTPCVGPPYVTVSEVDT
jgi:hypothetical protein